MPHSRSTERTYPNAPCTECLSGSGIEHGERPDPELDRRRRAAWGAYKSIEDVVKKTRKTRFRAHLFNTTVLPALTYASETWASRKKTR
ncbi:hypothetical protein RB195_015809 [Necator americanus]